MIFGEKASSLELNSVSKLTVFSRTVIEILASMNKSKKDFSKRVIC
jgi:hypothetical protein